MSWNVVFTKVFSLKKLFKWTINDFNKLDASMFISSGVMTAIDPSNGKEIKVSFQLNFVKPQNNILVDLKVNAYEWGDEFSPYYCINDDPEVTHFKGSVGIPWNNDIRTLTIFVDVSSARNTYVTPFKKVNRQDLGSSLKEMWKNDSSVKFTIKCGPTSIATFKPFLAAKSLFFKDMFESTTQNFVEIADFRAEVIQKMVEFCETDDIKEAKGYEDELFKFAHKFQIQDLMDYAVEKMAENANTSNIRAYLQLAKDYKLKDFEEWCLLFASRIHINL